VTRARPHPFKCSAVVSDVDGTLVTDDKVLTPGAQAAIADLRASGILFTIISARPPRGLSALIDRLALTTPVIGFNGGVIARPDLSTISEHLLTPEVAQDAVEKLTGRGVQVWVFSGVDWLVRDRDGPYVEFEQRTIEFPPTVVEEFGSALDAAAKIVGVSKDFHLLADCEQEMQTALGNNAFVVRSQPYYLDITHPLANKGEALSAVAKLLGVPLAEIAVIGDGSNDVLMFERGGLSIAMGNASQQVRQAADLLTDSNGDDGFAKAIERFILGVDRANGTVEIARAGSGA
jgi:Cof subfamily protein (haloacid dehalogenase superfamily)